MANGSLKTKLHRFERSHIAVNIMTNSAAEGSLFLKKAFQDWLFVVSAFFTLKSLLCVWLQVQVDVLCKNRLWLASRHDLPTLLSDSAVRLGQHTVTVPALPACLGVTLNCLLAQAQHTLPACSGHCTVLWSHLNTT